jgi:hypothetical protein
MKKMFAAIGRILANLARYTWIAGRLVLQPFAACVGLDLFSEDECEAAVGHIDRALTSAGRAMKPAVRATARAVLPAAGVAARGVGAVATGAAKGVGALALMPLRAVGAVGKSLLGGGGAGGGQSVEQAAAQAAQHAQAQQQRADGQQDARDVVQVLRRVLSARARGAQPDPDHVGRLPASFARYVQSLSVDECERLVAMPTPKLRDRMSGTVPAGIRSPEMIAQAPADELAAKRAARRDEVRERFRARTADDVLADIRMSA